MSCKGLIAHVRSMLHRTRMGGLHLCGCKDSENFWITQIYLRNFAKLEYFERVLQSLYGVLIVSVSVRWSLAGWLVVYDKRDDNTANVHLFWNCFCQGDVWHRICVL